jgi:hypothetical protein
MTVAAILGVKDEVELVSQAIAHLRRLGVVQMIISDYSSSDGTIDVLLDERRRHGDVVITHVDQHAVRDYGTWSIRELALAASAGTDWVVFLDADEFWVPASGSLVDACRTADADVILADRYNVVLTAAGPRLPEIIQPQSHGDLLLYGRRPDHLKNFVDAHPEIPFISLMPGPKVMVRPAAIVGVAPGHHDVLASTRVRKVARTDLLVAHVAFSSAARFARKIDNIRAELASHPDYFAGDLAWHWRRWAALDGPPEVEREFARQVVDDETLATLRSERVVQTAAEIFAAAEVWQPQAQG